MLTSPCHERGRYCRARAFAVSAAACSCAQAGCAEAEEMIARSVAPGTMSTGLLLQGTQRTSAEVLSQTHPRARQTRMQLTNLSEMFSFSARASCTGFGVAVLEACRGKCVQERWGRILRQPAPQSLRMRIAAECGAIIEDDPCLVHSCGGTADQASRPRRRRDDETRAPGDSEHHRLAHFAHPGAALSGWCVLKLAEEVCLVREGKKA